MIKRVYGLRKIYPACDKSQILADLTGKKTFNDRDMKNISALGYDVVVKPEPLFEDD